MYRYIDDEGDDEEKDVWVDFVLVSDFKVVEAGKYHRQNEENNIKGEDNFLQHFG
jgi:hypothetical protein